MIARLRELVRRRSREKPEHGGPREREPTVDEVAKCVEVLSRHGGAEVDVADSPARVWVQDSSDSVTFYVDFADPDSICAGQIYTTWCITIESGWSSPQVASFRSRRREDGGDDTVPPWIAEDTKPG